MGRMEHLMDWMDRTSEVPTPTWLKISVIVQGFLFVGTSGIHGPFQSQIPTIVCVGFGLLLLEVVALVGLWKMRRWAVYALVSFLCLYLATRGEYFVIGFRGVVVGAVLRSIGIFAGIALWRQLT